MAEKDRRRLYSRACLIFFIARRVSVGWEEEAVVGLATVIAASPVDTFSTAACMIAERRRVFLLFKLFVLLAVAFTAGLRELEVFFTGWLALTGDTLGLGGGT